MIFKCLYQNSNENIEEKMLKDSYKSGHAIGNVTISDDYLFVKKGFKCFYISYKDSQRIFRRVRSLHANICCGDGDLEVEYLVIMADDRELMEIALPGKKAAQMLMNELRELSPDLETKAPKDTPKQKEEKLEYKINGQELVFGCPLDKEKVFDNFMDSYSVYYNINRENITEGFDAEAIFDSKSEQYFLIKAAKVADIHTAEYVYFKKTDKLTTDELKTLDEKAWNDGISHVKPGPDHKNTDVVLIIFADSIDDDTKDCIKRSKHSKNYNHALYGYSNYRLIVIGLNEGIVYFNKQARILTESVGNIIIGKRR